ncbi:MAG: dihydroorotate dehydrogenase [Methanobacteriaceae archaeon]|nr:dihydroorotate dehydrogenase [Methanobacteriaceae archaeon]
MLETEISQIKLKNPLMLAAGILGTTASSMKMVVNNGAGAIVTKSFTQEASSGYKNPTVVKIEGGVINSVGLSNPGVEAEYEELLKLENTRKDAPLIASIYGNSEDVFIKTAQKVEDIVDAFELNVSCPHAKNGCGANIGENSKLTYDIVSSVKENVNKPVIVKLTPNVTDITEIACSAQDAGADALTLINSVGPGLRIDIKTGRPILNNKFGGLAGPMIKPIALRCVYQVYENTSIPIIGVGGIRNYKDALEFIYAGASALQIGTSIMYNGPEIFNQINQDLIDFLKNEGYNNIKELIGKAHKF